METNRKILPNKYYVETNDYQNQKNKSQILIDKITRKKTFSFEKRKEPIDLFNFIK